MFVGNKVCQDRVDTHRLVQIFKTHMAKSIQELDRDLLVLREEKDMARLFPEAFSEFPQAFLSLVFHYMRQVLDVLLENSTQTLEMKRNFLSGEGEKEEVPVNMDDVTDWICSRVEAVLIEDVKRDKERPQRLALCIGLCCYGAVLCSDGLSAHRFGDLFALCWVKLQTC